MRESQLRNVNKALKEEVRKLSKQPASSGSSPPSSTRPSVTAGNDSQQRAPSPISSSGPSSAVSLTHLTTSSMSGLGGTSSITTSVPPGRRSLVSNSPVSQSATYSSSAAPLPPTADSASQEYLKNIILKFIEFKDKRVRTSFVFDATCDNVDCFLSPSHNWFKFSPCYCDSHLMN